MQTQISNYIQEINNNGELQQLLLFISNLRLTKPGSLFSCSRLLQDCPIQSFINEVSKENEEAMDSFSSQLLPFVRHLPTDLSTKTTITMAMSAVCVQASSCFQPVLTIAETLKLSPNHLTPDIPTPAVASDSTNRLCVGGEGLEVADLKTLDQGQWLNDKVINAFVGLVQTESTSTDRPIYALPSYTAVLWRSGSMDHWMFKKVQFNKFSFIVMPVNIDNNHWVLMVANVKDRTITILDSLNRPGYEQLIQLWRQFMQIRDGLADIHETFGVWSTIHTVSSKQRDGHSCGLFTLMNAECLATGIPTLVMRQVHTSEYRKYIKARLVSVGKTKSEDSCDMPNCTVKKGVSRWVQCCVCGSWFHTRCCGVSTKAAIEEDFECCFCSALYN